MKNITFLVLIAALGCTSTPKNEAVQQSNINPKRDSVSFDWLVGVWERSMAGNATIDHFETWSKDTVGYYGTSITLIDDKVTEEKMWLFTRNDSTFYKAHPAQNETPTTFYITEIKDSFFRSENKQHDFPKYVEYLRRNDSLFAYIGDETQHITFKFHKQDERNIR